MQWTILRWNQRVYSGACDARAVLLWTSCVINRAHIDMPLSFSAAPAVQEPCKNVEPFRKGFMRQELVSDPYLKIVGVPL